MHHHQDLLENREPIELMVRVRQLTQESLNEQLIPNLQTGNGAHEPSIEDSLLTIATALLVTHFVISAVLFDLRPVEHKRDPLLRQNAQ